MATEIERDSHLILRAVYTWLEQEDDPKMGRYELSADEVLGVTGLPLERVEDAVKLLVSRDLLTALETYGGLQSVSPTADGRLEFQRVSTADEAPAAGNTYDVFLNHSSHDDQLSADVKLLLEHNGLTVFTTPSSIPSGKWEQQIEDALQDAVDCWVLLTPNALAQSVWVHHELGYYYGFRHGREIDQLGFHSHYIYPLGEPRPGLYDHLQGNDTDDIGNPEVVASIILESLRKPLNLPSDWEPRTYQTGSGGVIAGDSQFHQEAEGGIRAGLASDIESQGHWQIVIRPATFRQSRVSDFSALYGLVKDSQVRFATCDFPSMDSEAYAQSGESWMGEVFREDIPEAWTIHQSGQFVAISAFWDDLSQLCRRTGLSRESLFDLQQAVCFLTCVFEFAASLAKTLPGNDDMVIEVKANNVAGRQLATRRQLVSGGDHSTTSPSLSHVVTTPRGELVQRPRDFASESALELFKRFKWNPGERVIREIQAQTSYR
ncbi:MAG: hypothetical protein CL694_15545 [Chloroflexi bacterium]|nr:hypothetical protein [Chloroflexota bacterium]